MMFCLIGACFKKLNAGHDEHDKNKWHCYKQHEIHKRIAEND